MSEVGSGHNHCYLGWLPNMGKMWEGFGTFIHYLFQKHQFSSILHSKMVVGNENVSLCLIFSNVLVNRTPKPSN